MQRISLIFAILSFFILLSGCSSDAPVPDVTEIVFAIVDGEQLSLDFYESKKQIPGDPAVIWFAGGDGSNKSRALDEATLLADEGYTVFAPNYGLVGSQTAYPSYIHNIKASIRFIKTHASDYGINPDNIFVGGTSFGGVAAALAAITSDRPDLEGSVGGNLSVSSKIKGAIDLFGSVYFGKVEGSLTPIETLEEAYMLVFNCDDIYNCPDADSMMAERFVSPGDAPFLIIHGSDDMTSSPIQSEQFYEALTVAGIPATLILVDGYGHTDDLVSIKFDDILLFIEENTE